MIRGFSRESGDRSKFFIELTFIPDPDEGAGASPQLAATWGSFEIWVNGINLCMHREDGGQVPAVHWYLLPMIRWFVRNWDVLLHEERLPNRNAPHDAWHALQTNREAPPTYSPDATSAWEDAYDDWWSRHALLACREGGLFPDVMIRRKRDTIEISWGQSPLSGRPKHYFFVSGHDCACIPPEFVAEPLAAVLSAAIQHLCSEMPEEPQFIALRDEFHKLQNVDRRDQQFRLICGLRKPHQQMAQISSVFNEPWMGPFIERKSSKLAIYEAPQVSLMFGSVAPEISDTDIDRLIQLLKAIPHPFTENELLQQLICDEPIEFEFEGPWHSGYQLAEKLLHALPPSCLTGFSVDLENLYGELGVQITTVELDDKSIRAVAIAGENCQPTVAINGQFTHQHWKPRQFTLAHELCHLLHDRTHGVRLALASGPWAPKAVEQRANAFAAMLLMPETSIRKILAADPLDVESSQGIRSLARKLGASISSLLEHLCNLNFIDEDTRDALKDEFHKPETQPPTGPTTAE